jgi:hypothetical protein
MRGGKRRATFERTSMRLLIAFSAALILLLAGCQTSATHVTSGSAGEAFEQLDHLDHMVILPVKLPTEFHGNYDPEQLDRYRRDWPMSGARLIADGVTEETGRHVRAAPAINKPTKGYYFVLEISYLDLGDPEVKVGSALGGDKEGWSHVLATGRIMNAESGDQVVELHFNQSSGFHAGPPFENDMAAIGEKLGEWLNENR